MLDRLVLVGLPEDLVISVVIEVLSPLVPSEILAHCTGLGTFMRGWSHDCWHVGTGRRRSIRIIYIYIYIYK